MLGEKLSIIVPTKYENACQLDRTLHAIMGQLENHDELIVVDGSPNNNEELAYKYHKAKKVQVKWTGDDNTGIAGARNCGLLMAENDIIAFMDADCTPSKRYVHALRNLASHNRAIVQTEFRSYNPYDSLGAQHSLWRRIVRAELAKNNLPLLVNGRGFAIQRNLIGELGSKPFCANKKVHGGEDLLLGTELCKAGIDIQIRHDVFSTNSGDPNTLEELCIQKFVHGRGDATRGVLPADTFDKANFTRTVLIPIEYGVAPIIAISFWIHYLLGAYIADRPLDEIKSTDFKDLGIGKKISASLKNNTKLKIFLPTTELTEHPYNVI